MNFIKKFIRLFPGGKSLTNAISYRRRSRLFEQIGNVEDRFTHIYETNKWKNEESRSGIGSTAENTRNLRQELPQLIQIYGFETLLDAPCGDFNWFRIVERPAGLKYIGGEIVKGLVDNLEQTYGDTQTSFVHLDITRDPLPTADLWMCRDCLFHLSSDDIFAAMRNYLTSEIPYLLTSTHNNCTENIEIPTGHFRLLNLEIPPYNFPEPLLYVEDSGEESEPKNLGLWTRESLQYCLQDFETGNK